MDSSAKIDEGAFVEEKARPRKPAGGDLFPEPADGGVAIVASREVRQDQCPHVRCSGDVERLDRCRMNQFAAFLGGQVDPFNVFKGTILEKDLVQPSGFAAEMTARKAATK